MIQDIRKDALKQIINRAGPMNVHPDSTTGISVSQFGTREVNAASIMADKEEYTDVLANASSDYESDDAIASPPSTILLDVDSDTEDEEGGISLVWQKYWTGNPLVDFTESLDKTKLDKCDLSK